MSKFWRIAVYIGLPFCFTRTVICLCMHFPRCGELSFDYAGIIVGILSLFVVALIGWNIIFMIRVKDYIQKMKSENERANVKDNTKFTDRYLHKLKLYSECDKWLKRLYEEKSLASSLVSDMVNIEYPSKEVILMLVQIGAAKIGDNNELLSTEFTKGMVTLNYFGEKMEELEEKNHRDELEERSTKSSELSAKAAYYSAKSAKKANVLAIISIIMTFISIVISKCV